MSLLAKRSRWALHSRTPSMMLAWFNWSLMIVSSGPSSV